MTILSKIESNSIYYIIKKIRLLTLTESTIHDSSSPVSPELFSVSENDLRDVGRILTSDKLRRVVWYFLDYGAATSMILQFRVDVPEASAFRHIKTLRKMGVVVPAIKARKAMGKRVGPRPEVWMVPDAPLSDINEAQKLHRKLSSPKYVVGERMGQLILEEYIEPRNVMEITRRELVAFVREKGVKYSIPDLSDFAAEYLHERGITVWR